MTDAEKRPADVQAASLSAGGTHGDWASVSTVAGVSMVGAWRTDDHRYYFNGRGPLPSVTTALQVINKHELNTANLKQAVVATIQGMWDGLEGEDLFSYMFAHVRARRDMAGDVGSSVHILADALGASETLSTAFEVPEGLQPYLDAFRGFLGHVGGSQAIVSSEKMVWSLNGYGGTYDLVIRWQCEQHSSCLWLIDTKTAANGPYPDWGLQLAAYRWADGVVLPNDPELYRLPEFEHTAVLHLRPDRYEDTGWRLIEYLTTYKDDYIAFLGALELHKWKQKGRFANR